MAAATSTAASYQSKIREQFKRIRTREEELDDVKKRRKALAGKIESAEKKLAKMNTENKNLPQQTQLLESFRQQASELDVEVLNSEAVLWDYKRATTKTALGYKFCSLVEYAEKVSIVGEMGKLLLEVSGHCLVGVFVRLTDLCRRYSSNRPPRDSHILFIAGVSKRLI